MNILPKKRWHVRTKDNIARVRRDEAKAAEEEKEKQDRIKLAEREARTQLLRAKARANLPAASFIPLDLNDTTIPAAPTTQTDGAETAAAPSGHVNFFQDLEEGTAEYKAVNKEHEKEKKEEQEKYEKQIGYLTYLGQDTNEALGKTSWYNELPNRKSIDANEAEVNLKHKQLYDPLEKMKKLLSLPISKPVEPKDGLDPGFLKSLMQQRPPPVVSRKRERSESDEEEKVKKRKKHKKKHKKEKSKKKSKKRKRERSSSREYTSEDEIEKKRKLEELRSQRLKREAEERRKSESLLAKLRGDKVPVEVETIPKSAVKQKYNSQFCPEIAKQNHSTGK
ncbi:PREDICTED: leukocyte receptor cluster member 1 homolog [Nicrophorus vespilloides]|uniref:Leukocyte receptor cluster member 1 homolog n=1 Tax=Nicrophorus vespilloides TaxID=110193 RepID=A0ABM1MZ91_NICVS|nr:PREDICTED: leukocyte receptor cluster member 1 homolog [Nicrophorus vespilloides]